VSITLTPIALGLSVNLFWFTVLLSEVVDFAPEGHAGLTLEELEAGFLGAGKDRLKLGLLVVAVLELSLKSVR